MKLQIEAYKKKYTIETDYDDVSIEDYFDNFRGLLASAGWNQSTINDYIIELADELKGEI